MGRPKGSKNKPKTTVQNMSRQDVEDKKSELIQHRDLFTSKADYAALSKLILLDLKNYPYQVAHRFIGKYRKEDIINYLAVPELYYNQLQLRYISKYLYNVSSHYRRLTTYFATLLTFDYMIEPYGMDLTNVDKDKFRKQYNKIVNIVENMNIKHEFTKVVSIAFKEDCYYGYIHQTKDSFFLQQLNADYCKIASIEDGVYNLAFDFVYFETYPNRLYMFPQEFIDKFREFEKDGVRWRELDSKMTICIKVNETLEYQIPPFVGIFGNLLDIQDFKDLQKQREEIGNYKVLVQKIPMRQNTTDNNDYMMTLDHVATFHSNTEQALPQQIGLITTPMDITAIDFERDHPDINRVEQATNEFWDASGVSRLLFSGDSGAIAMNNSIHTDEIIAFTILRQLERWLNKYLKQFNTSQYKFRVKMLDTTVFNWQDVFKQYIQAGQYGLPVRSALMAILGYQPSATTHMAFLENEILDLPIKFIPMQSSHTQSGDGGNGGRPQSDEGDLGDEGIKSRDGLKNDNRAQ